MTEDTPLPFDLPAVRRKKVTADFGGGSISSDGGLVLLRAAERRLGLAEALAGCIREWRDPERVVHTLPAMLRFRMFAIACGYEDADDCDDLRTDPLFKLAVGRAPESGRDLCSQPSMSRLENAPSRVEVARMTAALVDLFCRSFDAPPTAITLDVDDTCDAVHGHQQLSLFNAHYDTRCFLPVHVYHVDSGKPLAVLLRPGKTPSGVEVRILLKHLVRHIRRHWPRTRLAFWGDSHYGRAEAMAWCEAPLAWQRPQTISADDVIDSTTTIDEAWEFRGAQRSAADRKTPDRPTTPASPVNPDPRAGIDLPLAVQREVVALFRDRNMREKALDQRHRSLNAARPRCDRTGGLRRGLTPGQCHRRRGCGTSAGVGCGFATHQDGSTVWEAEFGLEELFSRLTASTGAGDCAAV